MPRIKVFADYRKIDLSSVEGRKKMIGALTHFMQQPLEVQRKLIEAGVTEYTVTSAVGNEIRELIDRIHLSGDEIDIGYQSFFDTRDFIGTPTPGFRVRDITSGLTFSKRPEGGRANIYRITGTELFVSFDSYGGGLEFDQAWFDDQQWWMIEDTAVEFRTAWYRDKSTVMYDLIGNISSGANVTYDTSGANQLEKDIITINTACASLIAGLRAAKYPVNANTLLYILSPIQLKARLNRALAQSMVNPAVQSVPLKIEYNVQPIYSLNVRNAGAASTDKWYLGAPGMKNKLGEKMPLTVFVDFNARAFATTAVGWGRYGACLNESQFKRLSTS